MTHARSQFSDAPLPLFDHHHNKGDAHAPPTSDDVRLLAGLLDLSQQTASGLIDRFKGFNRVIAAPVAQLRRDGSLSSSQIQHLKRVEAIGHRMARSDRLLRNVISSWDDLLRYCQVKLAHRSVEELHVLFLDRQNRLIDDTCMASGTIDHVPVYPREILRAAIHCDAAALIVVHNHPSGDTSPSDADKSMTEAIRLGAEAIGITLHDHLIIGMGAPFSFRANSLL